jgi:hypothetical protein
MVDQNIASWNRIAGWLRQLDLVRSAVCPEARCQPLFRYSSNASQI